MSQSAESPPPDRPDGLGRLTAEVRELADRLEIIGLLDRYAAAIDTKSWAGLDLVFTPDAVLDYSSVGGPVGVFPVVRGWLESVLTDVPLLQHYVSGAIIDIAGDEAHGRCNLFNPMGTADGDGVQVRAVGGLYHDRFVWTEKGWRIAHRRMERRWSVDLGRAVALPPGP